MNPTEPTVAISPRDLMTLGLQQVAYVKMVKEKDVTAYAIHAADGTQVAVMASRELALATIRQNDLEPLSVH